jgi:GNAT superfamily N-acetyltransferase
MPNSDATKSASTIRPFNEEDRAFYRRIAPRLIPSETASPRDPAAMEAFFRRLAVGAVEQPTGAGTFVAVDDHGTPLGLIALLPDRDYFTGHGRAYVEALVVAPEAEGKGVGATLMQFAEQWARERGMREVVLDVFAGNEHARRFYERAGYRTDHLRMVKPLV